MSAESVVATLLLNMSAVETIALADAPAASPRSVTHSAFNKQATLNGASTPPVSKVAYFKPALVAGVKTIDLAALVGTNGAAVDGTGLKVRGFLFTNPSTNANAVTVKKGAANGYNVFGGATDQATLQPGDTLLLYTPTNSAAVAAGVKNIDLAGTGTQVFECGILLG